MLGCRKTRNFFETVFDEHLGNIVRLVSMNSRSCQSHSWPLWDSVTWELWVEARQSRWSTPTCTTTGIDVGGKRKKRYILTPKLALSIKWHKLWTEPRRGPMKSSNLQSDKINLYFNWQRLSTLVALHFQTPTVKLTSIWVPQNHPWTITGPSVLRQVSQRLSLADKHPYHSVALRWSGSHVLCLSFPISFALPKPFG